MDEDIKKTVNDEAPLADSLDPLAECEKKRDEYLAGWQRAKADFLNYKKEEAERINHLIRFGTEDLISELLSVVDNFDLAIATMEKQGQVDQGVVMIRSQLLDLLKRRGLEKLMVETGKPLDPLTSEAISEVDSEMPEGVVVREISAGYKLQDKIIRPARVEVSKGQNK